MKQNGIPCPNCNKGIVPLFTYTGNSFTLERIKNFGYCKICDKVMRVEFKIIE